MPRFFFHLLDDLSVDYIEGRELSDVGAAREQAMQFAADIASASAFADFSRHHSIQVAGDGGILIEVKLGKALGIVRKAG